MPERLRVRIGGLTVAEKIIALYVVVILVVGVVSLIPVVSGKDSVALWPLWLVGFPSSLLWTLFFQNKDFSFQGMPDELNWAVPILVWAPLLLASLIQASILWALVRRFQRKRRRERRP